ncbi:hypothetical protein [Nocardia pseudovaccinii]|uniref:hypothetical protein n=1 Tax=Nocardia pseudovaccinii TaxID=189540 RepID=UPI000ABB91EC|nr:hypothetical protein [Nocardia pseudovaccinii]
MKIGIRATLATSVVAAAVMSAASAHAAPVVPVADKIVCFVSAIEPWKTGHNSVAPINFGFKVHCTGQPALRNVTTKLWRYDPKDGKQYMQTERNDTSTNPDVETLYSASCSSTGILYQFHTEAIVNAFNGNWDRGSDNSSSVAAIC